jgi:hypothetical protein
MAGDREIIDQADLSPSNLDVSSGKSNTLVGFKDLGSTRRYGWRMAGPACGLLWQRFHGHQIGFVSKRDGWFHVITKDTNTHQASTISSDGKSAAVQQKFTFTLHILPPQASREIR